MTRQSASDGRTRGQRAPAALADKLRESILGASLLDGAALPTERELAAAEGVSRSSVREALRILEAEGLISTRPGRNGGPSVRRPTPESLERPLENFIRGRAIRSPDLLEALVTIEPAIARVAAVNRTEADLERLDELNRRLLESDDQGGWVAVNAELHVAIGEATHNDLLTAIIRGLAHAIFVATSADAYSVPGVSELAAASYDRIRAALADGDADAAERRMRRNIVRAVEIARAGAVDPEELAAVRQARELAGESIP